MTPAHRFRAEYAYAVRRNTSHEGAVRNLIGSGLRSIEQLKMPLSPASPFASPLRASPITVYADSMVMSPAQADLLGVRPVSPVQLYARALSESSNTSRQLPTPKTPSPLPQRPASAGADSWRPPSTGSGSRRPGSAASARARLQQLATPKHQSKVTSGIRVVSVDGTPNSPPRWRRRPASASKPRRPDEQVAEWRTEGGQLIAELEQDAEDRVLQQKAMLNPRQMTRAQREVAVATRNRDEAKMALRGSWHNHATYGAGYCHRDGWLHTRARENSRLTGARVGYKP